MSLRARFNLSFLLSLAMLSVCVPTYVCAWTQARLAGAPVASDSHRAARGARRGLSGGEKQARLCDNEKQKKNALSNDSEFEEIRSDQRSQENHTFTGYVHHFDLPLVSSQPPSSAVDSFCFDIRTLFDDLY
jgi:hypothetical protein